MLDHAGRLILGLGAGFREFEARAYGFEFGSPAERVQHLDEALLRIRRRWGRLDALRRWPAWRDEQNARPADAAATRRQ